MPPKHGGAVHGPAWQSAGTTKGEPQLGKSGKGKTAKGVSKGKVKSSGGNASEDRPKPESIDTNKMASKQYVDPLQAIDSVKRAIVRTRTELEQSHANIIELDSKIQKLQKERCAAEAVVLERRVLLEALQMDLMSYKERVAPTAECQTHAIPGGLNVHFPEAMGWDTAATALGTAFAQVKIAEQRGFSTAPAGAEHEAGCNIAMFTMYDGDDDFERTFEKQRSSSSHFTQQARSLFARKHCIMYEGNMLDPIMFNHEAEIKRRRCVAQGEKQSDEDPLPPASSSARRSQ